MPPVLYLFALTNLVIGTGAFAIGGILLPLSEALGVSVSMAGQAMTAYALASALIAPLLLMLTSHWPRRHAIALALGLFGTGAALSALSGSFALLLMARVLMGAGSMFTALAAGLVVALVPTEQHGRALSISFLGIGLSYMIGLPLGTWMGFRFGWQSPMWLIAACALLSLLVLVTRLPSHLGAGGFDFSGMAVQLRRGPVLRVWLRTLLYFLATFCVFSYVGPVMLALNPLTPAELSLTLMVFGLSGVVGTMLGGWASDRFGPMTALRLQLLGFAVTFIVVPLTQGHYLLTLAAFVVWGLVGFGLMAPQQALLASLAPRQAPLLFSLNSSMIYVGTALGAVVGGLALPWLGAARLPWVGLPFMLGALLTLWFDRDLQTVART